MVMYFMYGKEFSNIKFNNTVRIWRNDKDNPEILMGYNSDTNIWNGEEDYTFRMWPVLWHGREIHKRDFKELWKKVTKIELFYYIEDKEKGIGDKEPVLLEDFLITGFRYRYEDETFPKDKVVVHRVEQEVPEELGLHAERKHYQQMYKRSTCEKVLNEFMDRIEEVNNTDKFIYYVAKVVLFGSYINSDKEKLGDVDLAIYLDLKDKTKEETDQLWSRYSQREYEYNHLMGITYARDEIIRALKKRSNILSIHDAGNIDGPRSVHGIDEDVIYSDVYKVIFER